MELQLSGAQQQPVSSDHPALTLAPKSKCLICCVQLIIGFSAIFTHYLGTQLLQGGVMWCANKNVIIVPIITLPYSRLSLDTPTDTPTGTAQANSAQGSNNLTPLVDYIIIFQ